MLYSVAEVLEMVEEEPDLELKCLILRENKSPALLAVLAGALDPRVRWMLPPGPVRYTPAPSSGCEHVLHGNYGARTFYLYTVPPPGVEDPCGGSQKRREDLFSLLLGAVDPKDAIVLLAMKEKRLPYPSITPGIVAAAFPGYLAGVYPDALQKPQAAPQAAKSTGSVPNTGEQETPAKKRGRGRPKGSKNKGQPVAVEPPAPQSYAEAIQQVAPPEPVYQTLHTPEPEALWLGGGELIKEE